MILIWVRGRLPPPFAEPSLGGRKVPPSAIEAAERNCPHSSSSGPVASNCGYPSIFGLLLGLRHDFRSYARVIDNARLWRPPASR